MSLRRPELVNSAEHFPELKIKQVDGSASLPLPCPPRAHRETQTRGPASVCLWGEFYTISFYYFVLFTVAGNWISGIRTGNVLPERDYRRHCMGRAEFAREDFIYRRFAIRVFNLHLNWAVPPLGRQLFHRERAVWGEGAETEMGRHNTQAHPGGS